MNDDLIKRLQRNCPHDDVGCTCDEAADALTAQAAEIERLKEAMENTPQWQPLRTAPEGVECLLGCSVWKVPFLPKAILKNGEWWIDGDILEPTFAPTYWMLPPELPKGSNRGILDTQTEDTDHD